MDCVEITVNTADKMERKFKKVKQNNVIGSQSADQATEQKAANTEVIISDKKPRTLLLLCKHEILITEEDYGCMGEMYLR